MKREQLLLGMQAAVDPTMRVVLGYKSRVDPGSTTRIEALRRVAPVLSGVYFGLFLAAVVHWITGLERLAFAFVALALIGIGGAAGWANAKELSPLTVGERRDWVIGWGVVGALVGVALVGYLVETWN